MTVELTDIFRNIKMAGIKVYIEETVEELLHKVSWPTWNELQSSAIVVMIASVIIALIIYIMDSAFSNVMKLFYNMF